MLILAVTQSYCLFWEYSHLTILEKNLLNAGGPAGLLQTYAMPLCKSGNGAPFMGLTQPCARGAEPVSAPSACQLHLVFSTHMAACSPQELVRSAGPSLTLQELVRLMRFHEEHESHRTIQEGHCGLLSVAKETITSVSKPFSPVLLYKCEIITCLMQSFSTWVDFAPQGTFSNVRRHF